MDRRGGGATSHCPPQRSAAIRSTHLVHDVDDLPAVLAVLLEEVLDVLARRLDVLDLERALGVLVLRVDDEQDRVLGARRRGRDTGELAERLGL